LQRAREVRVEIARPGAACQRSPGCDRGGEHGAEYHERAPQARPELARRKPLALRRCEPEVRAARVRALEHGASGERCVCNEDRGSARGLAGDALHCLRVEILRACEGAILLVETHGATERLREIVKADRRRLERSRPLVERDRALRIAQRERDVPRVVQHLGVRLRRDRVREVVGRCHWVAGPLCM
jgi:hypothetical protein